MARNRLLVTGGSGLLGSSIVRAAAEDFEVFATYHTNPVSLPGGECIYLDIRNENEVASIIGRLKPNLVIHTAALAGVDYCEDHSEEARILNIKGAENMARASEGSKFIYISTDSVFDGEKGMYSEDDSPSPLSVYSKTKLEGELSVQAILPDSIIVRTAFYGWSLFNRTSLAEWVFYNLKDGNRINMFTDVIFSPIITDDLAGLLLDMYNSGLSGVYNVAGSEQCSKYAFGMEIARTFGFDTGFISPGSVNDMVFKAPRARNLSLNTGKIERDLNKKLPDLKSGIERFRDIMPN
ncbi:SDR family oxidoreductase [Chloroflexota bacterium]